MINQYLQSADDRKLRRGRFSVVNSLNENIHLYYKNKIFDICCNFKNNVCHLGLIEIVIQLIDQFGTFSLSIN